MESKCSEYDEYVQMLEEEREQDEIDQFLSDVYGNSDDEYLPSEGDISDFDMEILEVSGKRKRKSSSTSNPSKRTVSETSDSCQSTSTADECNEDSSSIDMFDDDTNSKLSKEEIG